MRKVFLDDLPRWEKCGAIDGIDWKNSVGHTVKFIYDDIDGEFEIVGYSIPIVYFMYNDKIKEMHTYKFIRAEFRRVIGVATREFKVDINDEFKDEKRDLTIINREYRNRVDNKGNNKWYKYKCNKCGWAEGWVLESEILKGCGCSCCYGMTVVEGINDIPTTSPWMIKYFQGGYDEAKKYTKCSNKKVRFKCPDCEMIKDKATSISYINKNNSIGCSCSDGVSYPNKILRYFIYNIKELYNVECEFEYTRKWTNRKMYDAYIKYKGKEYFIEMDGYFHKNNNTMSGMSAMDCKENDEYKDRLAHYNNIDVIRIDCEISEFDFIKKNLLHSEINKLFDLTNIKWGDIEKNSQKNIVKEVCSLKRCNHNLSTSQIGKIFDLSRATIIKYLKMGTSFNWCDYENDRLRKCEVFEDGISLGVFKSIAEIIKHMEEIHDVKLIDSNISAVAMGRRKNHKGYVFKYR